MNLYYRRKQKALDRLFNGKIKIIDEETSVRLVGSCSTWDEKVAAGLLVAKSGSHIHLINDVQVANLPEEKISAPSESDMSLEGKTPDVLIIGGGVVGCAIARELSKNNLNILLIEKEYDVATQATSRSDGMIHPGIDIRPGLVKKIYNNRGNSLYSKLTEDLEVDFERTGQYLCFDNINLLPIAALSTFYYNATVAGHCKLIMRKKLKRLEPSISDDVKFALFFDGAGIVCPFNITIALAENAIENGAEIALSTIALSMECSKNLITGEHTITSVTTNRGTIYPKLVINAAGVFADEIAEMAHDRFFSIHPRKGTSLILDKKAKANINTIYSLISGRAKKHHSKGGGMVSTVHGNVLVGPDAVETALKEDYTTEAENLNGVLNKQRQIAPWMKHKDIIAYFSGIRAATYEEDFIVEKGRQTTNILHIAGIQSPGLTAAPALGLAAEELAVSILREHMKVEKNPNFNPKRSRIVQTVTMTPEERNQLIKNNPDYGQIICRCEEVSKGEILDAIRRPLKCTTLDGIKRRVRPTAGRCQGGFCGPNILKLISEETGIPMKEVVKGHEGSNILFGERGNEADE